MSNIEKKLKLVRFWMIGIFAIIFGGVTAFLVLLKGGDVWQALASGWPIYLISAVVCVVIYYIYKLIVTRK